MTFPFPACVLRPCEERDLPDLRRLIASISGNLTSLPKEDSFIEQKVFRSLRAFDRRTVKPGDDHYLFVLEDIAAGEVVGTSGLIARVGGFDPFYSYAVRRERFSHPALNVEKEHSVLHLKTDHKGPSELCSLYLRPDRRAGGWGRLLSLGRFLFMERFRGRFDDRILAELRGHLDDAGGSPFWEGVGRHFFDHDFDAVDVLSGLGEKDFIRDLMPRHPIYTTLLSPAAQASIGRVHAEAEPAWRLLVAEGLEPNGEVDIFDAGPMLAATLATVRTVREVRRGPLTGTWESSASEENGSLCLISNDRLEFRAGLGQVRVRDGGVMLPAGLAATLGLRIGDSVAHAPAHPARGAVPVTTSAADPVYSI